LRVNSLLYENNYRSGRSGRPRLYKGTVMKDVPALKVEKRKKTYSTGVLALDSISLEVEAGRFFGLLGPNGAGKTTLINSIVSLARPDSGSVEVFGRDAYLEFREARRMIGVSPQEINLDKFLTVEETMLFHAGYYGVPKGKAKERTEELLERFALTEKRKQRVNTLSGGMKRRVLFARALMHDPKVLFLDEPTAGVDVELRYKLWGYIRELNRGGLTILLTTHYLEEAEALCEEIALINGGRIVAQGSIEELKWTYAAASIEEVYLKVVGRDISG
jgi:ABC-2 type transport system ATP-binding protein